MFETPRVLSLASAAVLSLALSQGVARADQPAAAPAPAAAPTAAAPAPAAPPASAPAIGVGSSQMDAMCDEHRAMREKMRNMTPEERQALREQHWKEMRARAAERGIEMPETPPWVAAEQRYKAAKEQFEKYRKTVEEMTPEQLEAARAMFGRGGSMPPMGQRPPMPQGGNGYGPQGGYWGGPPPMMGPGMPDEEGDMEQMPPPQGR
jgi:hypothetical protein